MIQLKSEVFASLNDTVEGLREALQQAVKLEHATIPTYLYALYSLQPGANAEIRKLVSSIIIEEMLHMTLACNILNAVGGAPCIDEPGFIPTYPGPLPGAVETGLIVPLSRFSKELLEKTFMIIEEPEKPLKFPVIEAALAAPPPRTIGQFYEAIKQQIIKLSHEANIFTGNPKKQVQFHFPTANAFKVIDVKSATAAIDLIVRQGEGTTTSPLDPEHQPAHYYRYAEIFFGKTLIANPDTTPGQPPFVYGGVPIPFDPAKVWPTVENPSRATYPSGSRAANANNTFNYTYTSLLKALHIAFNGHPERIDDAIGLMESLKELASALMSIDVGNGNTAGPSFEYNPVNS